MTEVMVEGAGWVCIVLVVDWCTKKAVDHFAGTRCKSRDWLVALERAAAQQFPESGIRDRGGS